MNKFATYLKFLTISVLITFTSVIVGIVSAIFIDTNWSDANRSEGTPAFVTALLLSLLFSFLRFEEKPYENFQQKVQARVINFFILLALSILGLFFTYSQLLKS